MASTSETGHATNIANFKIIIDTATALEGNYNPSNIDLTLPKITLMWNNANSNHNTFTEALQDSKNPINDRAILFKPINKLTTSALNILNSTKASASLKNDAKGLADIIRGAGLIPKKLADGTPNPDFISKSHQSFVQKQDAFKQFVDLLASEPKYAPNETHLQIVTLQDTNTALKSSNDNIGTIIKPVDLARINRDHILYDAEVGMIDTALKIKDYLKGVFGATSPESKLISGLKFTRPKKK